MSGHAIQPVSALADVAALLGSDGWLTPPLHQMAFVVAPAIGRVRTLSMAVGDEGPGLTPVYELLSQDLSDCVVVVAGAASLGGAIWGEILSTAAREAGAVGVVIDGWARDRPAMAELGLPVFARGERVAGPAGRAHVTAVDVSVSIDGVRISTKDAIVVDSSGCMRLQAAREWELLDAGRRYAAAEDEVLAALRSGAPLREAYLHKKLVVDALRAGEADEQRTGAGTGHGAARPDQHDA